MRKVPKIIAVVLNFLLIFSACSPVGFETTKNATEVPTTEEITTEEISTEEIIESTEQTDPPSHNFAYEVVYSGSWGAKAGDSDGFLLVTSREEIDNFVRLDSQSNEKYSSEWFETHALICVRYGHAGCDRVALNCIETGEKTMIIFLDNIHGSAEKMYKEQGKDYEVSYAVDYNHTTDISSTTFFIELDECGKEFVKDLKATMLKLRQYPSSEWRAGLINLRKEE